MPSLIDADDYHSFVILDTDGVLRSWAANGTVLDAARLDKAQVAKYISMRKGFVPPERTGWELATFAGVDGLGVSDEQLFDPPLEVWPMQQLKEAAAEAETATSQLPVPERELSTHRKRYCPHCVLCVYLQM